ncbi:unnamed protein product, partial [Oppiella nova]
MLFVGLNAFPQTTPNSIGSVRDVDPNQPEVKEAINYVFNVIHSAIDTTHAIAMGKKSEVCSSVVLSRDWDLNRKNQILSFNCNGI